MGTFPVSFLNVTKVCKSAFPKPQQGEKSTELPQLPCSWQGLQRGHNAVWGSPRGAAMSSGAPQLSPCFPSRVAMPHVRVPGSGETLCLPGELPSDASWEGGRDCQDRLALETDTGRGFQDEHPWDETRGAPASLAGG